MLHVKLLEPDIFYIDEEYVGQRLDIFLAKKYKNFSRSYLQKMIQKGNISVNDQIVERANVMLRINDKIIVILSDIKSNESLIPAYNLNLNIEYEDEHIIVINKPANVTVHPGAGNHQDTLVNNLIRYLGDKNSLSDIGGNDRPGIVHRLDKDTTGLMVVAKNNFAHLRLSQDLQERKIIRKYKAFIWGSNLLESNTMDYNIARSRRDPTKMTIVKEGGRHAITHYKILENFDFISLIECKLETGRTHQIRVHMTHIKHPIVGDMVYGKDVAKPYHKVSSELKNYLQNHFYRQALHAYNLSFTHPVTQEALNFTLDLPEDMSIIYSLLKNNAS